ncbi:MAG: histone deacetylase, partial [Pseudomonadota bacterium]
HAFGSGFCVFNDCAIALANLRQDHPDLRAAVVDLDVHQGDGNAALLAGPADPLTRVISVHGAGNFPFEKVPSDFDFPLADGVGNGAYQQAVEQAVARAVEFAPDLLFYIAGVDPLAEDRWGRLNVSMNGLLERDRYVLAAADAKQIPIVILIGGGYAEPIDLTVQAYRQTFETAREIYGL